MKVYIGCDPGADGGLALIDEEGSLLEYEVMPDMWGVKKFFDLGTFHSDVTVIIEKVHAMPGNGGVSMFSFGGKYHSLLMCAVCHDFRFFTPTPQEWKKLILAGTDKSKEASIQVCKQLFPTVNLLPTPRCKKDHDGMAEAILIAEYGARLKL